MSSEHGRPPSVDKLFRAVMSELGPGAPEAVALASSRDAINDAKAGQGSLEMDSLVADALRRIHHALIQRLAPAINATGVLLHTGLGRARLAPSAARAVAEAAASHAVVEIDPSEGKRGDRTGAVRERLCALTGAEDAFVVNNCAAAVLLALSAVCQGREALLSRGQMVEIGGSYRMPEIVKASGCHLVEVGCTNKTHLQDYEAARTERSGAVLRCHRSNFSMTGFVSEPSARELAEWAHSVGLPVLDDLGSGCLVDTTAYGLPKERTLQEAIADGADLVLASGDKMLAGPQAGIILGKSEWVQACKRHPMARAVRMDKLGLAALEATLILYLSGRVNEIPFWKYAAKSSEDLHVLAEDLRDRIGEGAEVREGRSLVGGGSLPEADLPTWCVVLPSALGAPDAIAAKLRMGTPPVFATVREDAVWLDPRTIDQDELEILAQVVRQTVKE